MTSSKSIALIVSLLGFFNTSYGQSARTQLTIRNDYGSNAFNQNDKFTYYGPILMGSSSVETQVAFDTGSDWVAVKQSANSNNVSDQGEYTLNERTYDSEVLVGSEATDKVCINDLCADQFDYFMVTNDEDGLLSDEINGILGLSMGGATDRFQTGPLLAQEIDAQVFSFYLDSQSGESYVDMGYADTNSMSNPDDLVEISMRDHFFWRQDNYGMRFDHDPDQQYTYQTDYENNYYPGIFDTGSTLVHVPQSLWEQFIERLFENAPQADAWEEQGQYITECNSNVWPSVELWFDGYWLEISSQDYIIDISQNVGRSNCMIGFTENKDDFWILGNVFMQGWYSVHDMENQTIGFVPHSNSYKSPAIEEQLNTSNGPNILSLFTFKNFAMTCAVVFIILTIVLLLFGGGDNGETDCILAIFYWCGFIMLLCGAIMVLVRIIRECFFSDDKIQDDDDDLQDEDEDEEDDQEGEDEEDQ